MLSLFFLRTIIFNLWFTINYKRFFFSTSISRAVRSTRASNWTHNTKFLVAKEGQSSSTSELINTFFFFFSKNIFWPLSLRSSAWKLKLLQTLKENRKKYENCWKSQWQRCAADVLKVLGRGSAFNFTVSRWKSFLTFRSLFCFSFNWIWKRNNFGNHRQPNVPVTTFRLFYSRLPSLKSRNISRDSSD